MRIGEGEERRFMGLNDRERGKSTVRDHVSARLLLERDLGGGKVRDWRETVG